MATMNRSKLQDRLYKCEMCGIVKEALYPALKKRFCSHKCSNQWKWNNLFKRGRYVECCMLCGNMVWAHKRDLTADGRLIHARFCSVKCWGKYRETAYLPFLKGYTKGLIPWNTGKTMNMDFRLKAKFRAQRQWKDLSFREKQMKRDYSKWFNAGILATRRRKEDYIAKYGLEAYKNLKGKGGLKVGANYLKKLGIKI